MSLWKKLLMKINILNCNTIHIYTDGACRENPGPAGCGVILIYNSHIKEYSEYIGKATNNIAELTAIKIGLEALKSKNIPIVIYSDSSYSIGVLSQNWKPKKNKMLILKIKDLIHSFDNIKFVKVKGHSGDKHNERADKIANLAVKQHIDAYQ